jgi:hypothetical protein
VVVNTRRNAESEARKKAKANDTEWLRSFVVIVVSLLICYFLYQKRETICDYIGRLWMWFSSFFAASSVNGSSKLGGTKRVLIGTKPDACIANATSKTVDCISVSGRKSTPNTIIDSTSANEVSEGEKLRMWEDITKWLWADFLHKLDDLCEILQTAGVSGSEFKGAIRMAAKVRYDEWLSDKEFYLMRIIVRVENCLRLVKDNVQWSLLRRVNFITKECELENVRLD